MVGKLVGWGLGCGETGVEDGGEFQLVWQGWGGSSLSAPPVKPRSSPVKRTRLALGAEQQLGHDRVVGALRHHLGQHRADDVAGVYELCRSVSGVF